MNPSATQMLAMVAVFAITLTARSEFDGPYSLTPPTPGFYSGVQLSLFTNNWKASSVNASVNTSFAPLRLDLSVPSGSVFPNGIAFSTVAVADGMVSFDATTVSRAGLEGGYIAWFRQSGTVTLLDQAADNETRHFDFLVAAGDVFGFRLASGSDVIEPGAPLSHILRLENFFAPIPEPTTSLLLGAGAVFWLAAWPRRDGRSTC